MSNYQIGGDNLGVTTYLASPLDVTFLFETALYESMYNGERALPNRLSLSKFKSSNINLKLSMILYYLTQGIFYRCYCIKLYLFNKK